MRKLTQEEIKLIMSQLVREAWPKRPSGGQQVNRMPTGVRVYHPDIHFEICCNEHRTQMENIQDCMLLWELWLGSL